MGSMVDVNNNGALDSFLRNRVALCPSPAPESTPESQIQFMDRCWRVDITSFPDFQEEDGRDGLGPVAPHL